MLAISDAHLLALWERGRNRHSLDRALLTLGAAQPVLPGKAVADWPMGRRNQALAELHCRSFGSALRGWTACTHCGEKLEFALDASTLAHTGSAAEAVSSAELPQRHVAAAGCLFRLPTSRDLASVVGMTNEKAAAQHLAERCLVQGSAPTSWSAQELDEIGERMAQADPLAETSLALECPACHHAWSAALDLISFIWAEIEAHCRRVLFAVHTLARAYGWTENEILSLSHQRRRLYLQMIQS